MRDAGYLSLVDKGGRFVADEGFDERLVQLVVADEIATPAQGRHVTGVRSALYHEVV